MKERKKNSILDNSLSQQHEQYRRSRRKRKRKRARRAFVFVAAV